ncbi:hypothetical protein CUJ84_pRLN1000432 (plasmid) [Rhizobium leguminosarum]|uniref:Uncharacterized protein n=1 Tax=Rhizobium leguminosarum TaxID=384 RepID=A0A2K9ZCA9_RHILE|nr:hypothetical protein CUJ84_pRLN1000432 [Rhizobium leguminosarum]
MSVTSLGFSEEEFAEALLKVSTVGAGPVDAVEHLLAQTLAENLSGKKM